jgi:hypothetical protein
METRQERIFKELHSALAKLADAFIARSEEVKEAKSNLSVAEGLLLAKMKDAGKPKIIHAGRPITIKRTEASERLQLGKPSKKKKEN